jgi:hypothetical protein
VTFGSHESENSRTDGKIAARTGSWLARIGRSPARIGKSSHGRENGRTKRILPARKGKLPAQTGKSFARSEFLLHEPVSRNPVLTFGEIRCFIPAMAELDQLLQATSRSFYLTLGVLPALVAKR